VARNGAVSLFGDADLMQRSGAYPTIHPVVVQLSAPHHSPRGPPLARAAVGGTGRRHAAVTAIGPVAGRRWWWWREASGAALSPVMGRGDVRFSRSG